MHQIGSLPSQIDIIDLIKDLTYNNASLKCALLDRSGPSGCIKGGADPGAVQFWNNTLHHAPPVVLWLNTIEV